VKRQAIGIGGFHARTVMPEVSPNGGKVFVRVNQVLVRLWALPSQV
jgi:hypothetical protein